MEIIYVLCTLYYALQPMLLEVLCLICVSEMPKLKNDQGSTVQAGNGVFIFCDVCQVSISVRTQIETITKAEIRPSVQKSVCTHPHAKVLTAIEVITH